MSTLSKEELLTYLDTVLPKPQTEEERKKQTEEILEACSGKFMEIFNDKYEHLTKAQENKMQKVEPEVKEEPKWKSFGEQLQAVARVETRGIKDTRLVYEVYEKQLGMNEGVGAQGGFLVAPEFSKQLLMQTYETGILTKDCWRVPIASNRLVINAINEVSRATGARFGSLLTYWLAEAGTKLPSHPTLRQIDLKLNKHIGLYYATDELLEDTNALEAIVSKMFADEFGWRIDDAILNGVGVGMPLGILAGGGLVLQAAEPLQPVTTIVAENVQGMWNLMSAKYRTNAKWYINQDAEPQLMRMFVPAGLGGLPVYLPAGGFVNAPNGTLFGRPIQPIEQSPALGAVGDIVFADMSQYILVEKAGGIQAASSIHVAFLTDQQVFRFVLRIDGQPIWNSGILAADGITTRSPYVALAGRP